MDAKADAQNEEVIDITDTWWNKLNELPFVSCKWNIDIFDLCPEQKGKTLFLLKHASKPVQQVRKRRKLNIYGEQPVDADMNDEGEKKG